MEDGNNCCFYIYRTLDITTILMMDTPKWTSFAFCVSDGLKDESKLSKD
jgi:lysophospholipid acyltransferase